MHSMHSLHSLEDKRRPAQPGTALRAKEDRHSLHSLEDKIRLAHPKITDSLSVVIKISFPTFAPGLDNPLAKRKGNRPKGQFPFFLLSTC